MSESSGDQGSGRLSFEAQLAVISRDMDRFEGALSGLGAKMDAIHSSLDSDINATERHYTENKTFQDRIEGSLRTLQAIGIVIQIIVIAWVTWVTAGHASDADRLTHLEDDLRAQSSHLGDDLKAHSAMITQLSDKLDKSVEQIETRFDSVPADIKVLLAQVSSLQQNSAKLEADVEDLQLQENGKQRVKQ
jgi:DNA repair exonuclease SbcCD ATPase subunit